MQSIEIYTDPAVLAQQFAEEFVGWVFASNPADEHSLAALEREAEIYGFLEGSYFVQSNVSFAIPATFAADEEITFHSYRGLTFEGRFGCYSIVKISEFIGVGAVRSVCMAFNQATLLPYFEDIPEKHLLFTPVLAIQSISNTKKA